MHVCYSDPGEVNSKNFGDHLVKYPFDNVLYTHKMCDTCKIIRPPRSKHCSLCKRCVARFDHHCPWINSDVGAGNLWKFLVFLFSTGAVCSYCAYLCFYVLYGILEQNQIWNAVIRTSAGDIPVTWSHIIQYLTYYNGILVGLGAFCALISLVLYGFWGYHCFLISKNTTTNETFKWDDIKDFITQREKKLISDPKNEKHNKQNQPKSGSAEPNSAKSGSGKNSKKTSTGNIEKEQIEEKKITQKSEPNWTRESLRNIYNNGITRNFYEVFFYKDFNYKKFKK